MEEYLVIGFSLALLINRLKSINISSSDPENNYIITFYILTIINSLIVGYKHGINNGFIVLCIQLLISKMINNLMFNYVNAIIILIMIIIAGYLF